MSTPAIFKNLHGKVPPEVEMAFSLLMKGRKDNYDAILALKNQQTAATQTVNNISNTIGTLQQTIIEQITTVSESVPEGRVNQQTVPYAIQNSDYGGTVILQGGGPYDITLNSAVSLPYYTSCFNLGSVSASVTPDLAGATVNNVASLTLLPNQYMWIFFDGLNWWALTFILPVTIAKVTHQWLDSYTAGTGVFTQSQPAAADLSDGTQGTGAVLLASTLPLSGTSASIGGAAMTAGQTISTTVSVTGAATSMAVVVSPQTYPGDGFVWDGYVSAANTVTVRLTCVAAGTPSAAVYNCRVVQ